MATIADRKPDVLLELGNRADINNGTPSRLDKWFRDSYIELAMSVPFAELEASLPDSFQPTITEYTYPSTVRALRAPIVGYNTDGSTFKMNERDITFVRQTQNANNPGPPSVYALFGQKLIVGPTPDKAYVFNWDAWLKPTIAATIADTVLAVPDDWLEIVDLGAALRGHRALLEREKAMEIQQLLFGYKTETGKMIPGLITNRMTMRQAQSPARDYGLAPTTRSYT